MRQTKPGLLSKRINELRAMVLKLRNCTISILAFNNVVKKKMDIKNEEIEEEIKIILDAQIKKSGDKNDDVDKDK